MPILRVKKSKKDVLAARKAELAKEEQMKAHRQQAAKWSNSSNDSVRATRWQSDGQGASSSSMTKSEALDNDYTDFLETENWLSDRGFFHDTTFDQTISCEIVDGEGTITEVWCIFDAGTDSSFITPGALARSKQHIKIQVEPIPLREQHTYRTPMFAGTCRFDEYVQVRVRNPLFDLKTAPTHLYLLSPLSQNGSKKRMEENIDIIFGADFIERNGGADLWRRIRVALDIEPSPFNQNSLFRDKFGERKIPYTECIIEAD